MTSFVASEEGDEFIRWCHAQDVYDEDIQATMFAKWIAEQTGWDGTTFSLTEAERWWIQQANETLEWLRVYAMTSSQTMNQVALDAAIRCLAQMKPIPSSLLA